MWKHVTSHMCCCDPPKMSIAQSPCTFLSLASVYLHPVWQEKSYRTRLFVADFLIWFLFTFQNDVSIHVPNSSSPHGPRADQPQGQGGEGDHRRPQALHHAQQPQQRGEVAWEVAQNCSPCIISSDLKASWLIWWRSSQLCWVSLSTSTITLRRSAVAKIKKL